MAEINLSEKDIRKFTDRIGRELKTDQNQWVHQFNQTGQVARAVPQVPTTVAVMVDAGRAQIRQEDAGRGVHGAAWCAPRYAALRSLSSQAHSSDPHPEVPRAFLDEKHVRVLTDQIHNRTQRTAQVAHTQAQSPSTHEDADSHPAASKNASPTLLSQVCVAAVDSSDAFGPIVAAEAARQGFYLAPRKAFVADGEACNWTIQQDFFFEFTPILDFVHCVGYLFSAACAAKQDGADPWRLYQTLVTAAWKGETDLLLATLQQHADALGPPPKNAQESDPRKILAGTLGYIRNHAARMDYPRYRKLGLPLSSCHIESLIKRFNLRVKGSDKFWVSPCLDNVLQVRAAWLSDDSRWENFWKQRACRVAAQTRPYRRAG